MLRALKPSIIGPRTHLDRQAAGEWGYASSIRGAVAKPIYIGGLLHRPGSAILRPPSHLRDGGPPAKRGLIFSGVATTLGVGAGALFTFGSEDSASTDTKPAFARIYGFSPFSVERGAGVAVSGELQ